MPRKDRTYSAQDVIRIYSNHLDARERSVVEQYFGRFEGPEDPFLEEREAFQQIIDRLRINLTPFRALITLFDAITDPFDVAQGALLALEDLLAEIPGNRELQ